MSNTESPFPTKPQIPQLLGILFVALKFTGVIQWPWIWVLCPFWAPLALITTVAIVAFSYYLTLEYIKSWKT